MKTTVKNSIRLLPILTLAALTSLLGCQPDSDPTASRNNQQYLQTHATEQGVISMPSGLQYKVLTEGNGASPAATDTVTVHYRGALLDGTEFDSSYSRGEPASFPVNRVIAGWTEALQLMHEGDKWELTIPPHLGYGSRGAGSAIPADSVLVFEVELLKVEQ
jgi:FKBP-type peptidyl-prolyl cis-trans isomerase FklB